MVWRIRLEWPQASSPGRTDYSFSKGSHRCNQFWLLFQRSRLPSRWIFQLGCWFLKCNICFYVKVCKNILCLLYLFLLYSFYIFFAPPSPFAWGCKYFIYVTDWWPGDFIKKVLNAWCFILLFNSMNWIITEIKVSSFPNMDCVSKHAEKMSSKSLNFCL